MTRLPWIRPSEGFVVSCSSPTFTVSPGAAQGQRATTLAGSEAEDRNSPIAMRHNTAVDFMHVFTRPSKSAWRAESSPIFMLPSGERRWYTCKAARNRHERKANRAIHKLLARTKLPAAGGAVCRERLRRADLRNRLVSDAPIGDWIVGGFARSLARHLHGWDVLGEPGVAARRFAAAASVARICLHRSRHWYVRRGSAVVGAVDWAPLCGGGRARVIGDPAARGGVRSLFAATDRADGGDVASDFALGGDNAAGGILARVLLWGEHRRSGGGLFAGGVFPAARSWRGGRNVFGRGGSAGG